MKTILIIDDEPLIAAGLSEKIDWAAVGCRVVGTAANGVDGLRLIEELMPDIVITDIVMPGYNGIELAEKCRQLGAPAKVILLSAHSDFEYAQQAIRLNVTDYVLKPIESKRLVEAVMKAAGVIDEERRAASQMDRLETAVADARQFISSSVLFEIARHGEAALPDSSPGHVREVLARPGVVLCVALYNLPRSTAAQVRYAVREAFRAQMEGDGVEAYYENREKELVLLCSLPEGVDHETGRKRILKSAGLAVEAARSGFPGQGAATAVCVCMVGAPYRSAKELRTRYREALDTIPAAFFLTQSGTVPAESLQPGPQPAEADIQAVVHHLVLGNTAQMNEALRGSLATLRAAKDRDRALDALRELYRTASGAVSKADMSLRPAGKSLCIQENFEQKSLEVEGYLTAVSKYIEASKDFVGRLKLLVEENYSNRGFSLSTAADMMGISTSYLSRLFKKQAGHNFIDYLLNKRIDRARYLLETTTLRNRQIAEQVGFENDQYFSQVFKKHCGVTPKQYREAARGGTDRPATPPDAGI